MMEKMAQPMNNLQDIIIDNYGIALDMLKIKLEIYNFSKDFICLFTIISLKCSLQTRLWLHETRHTVYAKIFSIIITYYLHIHTFHPLPSFIVISIHNLVLIIFFSYNYQQPLYHAYKHNKV